MKSALTTRFAWPRPRIALPFALGTLMTLLNIMGVALSAHAVRGPWYRGEGALRQLLAWDGAWYLKIAAHGYHAFMPEGFAPGQYAGVAFFPLYPLIESVLLPRDLPWAATLLGALFGVWSIFAFDRLARATLPPRAAARAMILYALWPAAVFFAMGYPTGLINLCAISALGAHARGETRRAAIWCGIGTAAAPTMAFIAAGLSLHRALLWLRNGAKRTALTGLVAFAVVSFAGLAAYMAYLAIEFGDPLIFVSAQRAWGPAPSFGERLMRFFGVAWFLHASVHDMLIVWRDITGQRSSGAGLDADAQHAVQHLLNLLAVAAMIAGLVTLARKRCDRGLLLAGSFSVLGFLWFHGTSAQGITSGARLVYPCIAGFLGLGALGAEHPRAFVAGTAAALLLVVLEAASAAAGYWVT